MKLMFYSKISVRARIAVLFSSIVIILSIFYHNYIKEAQYETFIDGFKYSSEATFKYVQTGLKYGLQEENWAMLREVLDWAKQDSDRVVFVALYETDGQLFTSFPENLPYSYKDLTILNEKLSFDNDIYIKSKILEKTKLGEFEFFIGFSTKELKKKQHLADKMQFSITLIILVIGLLLSFLFSGTITKPLRKLNIVAKKIASGDYELRADITKGGKEIKELSLTFNQMVQQILDSQEKLLSEMTKYNQTLDIKNTELTDANEALQTIVKATSQTGEEFLKVFVKNLASAMKVKYAAVMEVLDNGKLIRIIANWDRDDYGDNFEYSIEGTPCQVVVRDGLTLFDNNIKSLFSHNSYLIERNINYYLGTPLKDSDDNTIGIISIFDDKKIELNQTNEFIMRIFAARVSSELERVSAEDALRESEVKFRTLSLSAQDAIIMMNSDGKISFWNEAAERIFGYSIDEAMGKDVHNLLAPKEVYEPYMAGMLNFRKTGQGKVIGSIQEMTAFTKNGESRAIELSLSSVQIKGNWEAIGIARDVTTRKIMENDLQDAKQKAEEANRAKSEFLANMSHEIRTPMNAILGFSQILQSKITDVQHQSYVEAISSSGRSLLGLINDILDLSKIEAGKLSLEYEAVNPYKIFKEIENVFAYKIREKGLEFIIEIDEDLPKGLILDEIRLRQILVNLVGNALKFTENGYIKISVHKEFSELDDSKLHLKFSVEDSGIGIPEMERDRIFDAFIQQSGQSTRKYGGTGLGLAITKRLVEMMNGKIFVEASPDNGSKFVVIIDNIAVASTFATDEKSIEDYEANYKFFDSKILIVDDIDVNRKLIIEFLEGSELDIKEADNGQLAIDIALTFKPDIILMDMKMPVMDGVDATKNLKLLEETKHIPIIALTASAMKGDEEKMKQIGCSGYLSKPVEKSKLMNVFAKFLPSTKSGSSGNISDNSNFGIAEQERQSNEFVNRDSSKTIGLKSTGYKEEINQELKDLLRNDILQKRNKIRTGLIIGKVRDFAIELKHLSEKYNSGRLMQYSEILNAQASNFDLVNLRKSLDEFDKLLD